MLSYLRAPQRWVLKTPQHLEQLGPLLETFPDATIAFTLRDPVAVLQSAHHHAGLRRPLAEGEIEPDELAAYWIDRIERLLRAALRDSHLIPTGQRVDVEFGAFMPDDLAMATRILEPPPASMSPTDARSSSRPIWPGTPGARRAA